MSIYRFIAPKLPRKLIYNRYNIWGKTREMPEVAPKSFEQIYKELKS